ncbi:anaphase-promoting complex, subunit 10-domain-containing protein [Tricharina praecox]|uniref:anaphase-promoting complex, subunit 10-domain-containing protein n=1 Tax=Tricharina praecox TaxID=43433 RepID=UPI00221FFB80|nr:anaphase-promoting complex, subunit 10-domain-containing protein [Tricharina praecox]KAI5850137.1 anaphase-promoting complex, subunit 10-domain-containing protein [Tricharina praecox]
MPFHRISRRRAPPPPSESEEDSHADQETISQGDSDNMSAAPTQRDPTTPLEDSDEPEELEDEEEEEEEEEYDGDVHSATSTDAAAKGLDSLVGLKEIGNLASWTVSTAKPGNGVEQLRDEDTTLFWQSDGPQPHHINIHFAKRVKVKRIRMYLDFENDESYTPTKMSVLSGTGFHDLIEVTKLDLERPTGWIEVRLDDVHEDGELRTFLIQVAIHANHQNGKDTHVRGLQIYAAETPGSAPGEIEYTNISMLQELQLR